LSEGLPELDKILPVTPALAALAFAITFGLTLLWLTDRNTAFCNSSATNVGFVLCRIEHGARL
jgi:hypothetical protein